MHGTDSLMKAYEFFFEGNMPLIYFVYGLSFLVLGILSFAGKQRHSRIPFMGPFLLLSVFAITHGLHEWIEIFILGYSSIHYSLLFAMVLSNAFLLILSYIVLFQFGVDLISLSWGVRYVRLMPVIFFILWLLVDIIAAGGSISVRNSELASLVEVTGRYLFCLPGCCAVCYGLVLVSRDLRDAGRENLSHALLGASLFFGLYGILGGIVTPYSHFGLAAYINYETFTSLFGIPVQLFRGLCAFLITVFLARSIALLDLEQRRNEEQRQQEYARLEERNRIAMDLHDGIQQILFSIGMQISALIYRIKDEGTVKELENIRDLVQKGISEIRYTVLSLHSREERGITLREAVRMVAKELFGTTAVKVEIRFEEFDEYPGKLEKVIFRFFQEGLMNAYKHSRATMVELGLREEGGNLLLWISDNGVGIPAEERKMATMAKSGRIGISGMRERVEKLGGSLTIKHPPGGGLRVDALIPHESTADQPKGAE